MAAPQNAAGELLRRISVHFIAQRMSWLQSEEFTMKDALIWLTWSLVLAAGLLLLSFQAPHELNRTAVAATYSHGILRATIPYVAPHAGAGRLTLEVLDPEDQIQGRIERSVNIKSGK